MLRISDLRNLVVGAAIFALAACVAAPVETKPTAPAAAAKPMATAAKPGKLEITDASFGCIRNLKAVRGFFVGNLMGNVDATVAVANSGGGQDYPPGSIIQLVPGEAMVKHEKGFNPATRDWEFFELNTEATGTKIHVRGFTETVNQFGGNCFSCHAKADAKWDMVCESTHGCDPIPVTPVLAKAIQNTDPRCPKVDLPADQQAALQQLAALRAAAAARATAPAKPQ